MSRDWCSVSPHGLCLAVHLIPNARKTEIVGIQGDALKIRLQAPAVEGKANEALVRFLADILGVSKNAVEITHGHTARRKLIAVKGTLELPAVKAALLP